MKRSSVMVYRMDEAELEPGPAIVARCPACRTGFRVPVPAYCVRCLALSGLRSLVEPVPGMYGSRRSSEQLVAAARRDEVR